MDEPQGEGGKPDGDTMGVKKPKRKYRKKQEDLDLMFEAGFGLMYGIVVGIGQMELVAQILGKPHEERMCLSGEKCPIHSKKVPEYRCKDCGTRNYSHVGPDGIFCDDCYSKRYKP
jgi:hypothetical protein